MSEIKNNEKTIDNPPVKAEEKKAEDYKKQEQLGKNLDGMSSSGTSGLENKSARPQINETAEPNAVKESKLRKSDAQDKKTERSAGLDGLSSTGEEKREQKKPAETESEDKRNQDANQYYDKVSDAVKQSYESSDAEEKTANHKLGYKLDQEEKAEKVREALRENPEWKPDPVGFKNLGDEDKQKLSDQCAKILENTPEEGRGDARVPSPEKIKGVTSDGRIIEDWKPNTDGALEGTRRMEIPQKGQIIDRVGSENGTYFSPMKESGEPYSADERAIGDRISGNDVTKSNAYHKYEVKMDFTKENFQKAILNSNDLTNAERINMRGRLEEYYNDCESTSSAKHRGEAYAKNGEPANGVKTADAAPMFKKDDGGAVQYDTPFSAAELKKMGMIEDIKNEDSKTEDGTSEDKNKANPS